MTARKYAPVCSYPGCGRKHNARGLCGPHGAMQRNGQELRPIMDRSGPIATPDIDRFAAKVALQDDGCVVWLGGKTTGGYGVFHSIAARDSGQTSMAHRWLYEYHIGSIPADFDVDHLCRNRACVNPEHLEPVTRQENIRRASAVKTTCPAGHPYDSENTYVQPGTVHRRCRTCSRERDLARADAKNAKRRAARALQRLSHQEKAA